MPPCRTPLGPIDGNRVYNEEYTPYTRGKIIGVHRAGMRTVSMEREFGVTRGGIISIIAYEAIRLEGATQPRTGTPRIYSDRDCRVMLKNLRLYPKQTFDARRAETGMKCSNSWIKDLARVNGLSHWRAKKRPELTEEVAQFRYDWARARAHWDVAR
jgi:hypothetical protein